MNDNIVLIGFMGAGKTTFGHWISENINMKFLDTDDYIEDWQNKKIKDIFATDGEEHFRNLETECLKRLDGKLHSTVLSVGGGMPMRPENQKLLKKIGCIVYLFASKDELARRLSGDNTRPMLAGDELPKRIHQLMDLREGTYLSLADVVLDTTGKTLNQMYNEIEDNLIQPD